MSASINFSSKSNCTFSIKTCTLAEALLSSLDKLNPTRDGQDYNILETNLKCQKCAVQCACFHGGKVSQNLSWVWSGLGKNPGFSSKTQPRWFNWFKPGFNGFFGLNWGKIRLPM